MRLVNLRRNLQEDSLKHTYYTLTIISAQVNDVAKTKLISSHSLKIRRNIYSTFQTSTQHLTKQSNLATGDIAVLSYSPDGSTRRELTRVRRFYDPHFGRRGGHPMVPFERAMVSYRLSTVPLQYL